MLQHFVWEDFRDVLADLRAHGFDLKRNGSLPKESSASPSAVRLTMKAPSWNCVRRWSRGMFWAKPERLGERYAIPTGSTERLQVKLTTAQPDRYTVTCNGRGCP